MLADLIELPAGERPLRGVVGSLITAGVRDLRDVYERGREQLLTSSEWAELTVSRPAAPLR